MIAYTVDLSLRESSSSYLILFMPFIPRTALVVVEFYPWFTFYFLCFKLIIPNYHTLIQTQRKIKFKPRIKLNHNIMIVP